MKKILVCKMSYLKKTQFVHACYSRNFYYHKVKTSSCENCPTYWQNLEPNLTTVLFVLYVFSSPELAQGELLGYRDVRCPSYVWTSVTSETYETSEMSVRQLFSLCTL